MRTTTGPLPAERTKMSAPAGLWTICDLKLEGNAGCAAAICAAMTSEVAIRVRPMIVEQRPMHFSLYVMAEAVAFLSHTSERREDLDRSFAVAESIFLLTCWY